MTGIEFLTLSGNVFSALASHYGEARKKVQKETGMAHIDFWVASRASELEPEPISATDYVLFNPYNPEQPYEQLLVEVAERGFIAQVVDGQYRLTEKGRRALNRYREEGTHAPLSGIDTPLSDVELERLASLVLRVIQHMQEDPELLEKPSFVRVRKNDPGQDAHVLVRIYYHIIQWSRYRDDSHTATWRPLGVSGPTWETLSFLWEEKEMSDLKELYERRGHLEGQLEAVLQALVQRGWAEQDGAAYRITEMGRSLRQEAEEKTDQYFEAPWACLDEKEKEELRGLLVRLSECSIAQDSQE